MKDALGDRMKDYEMRSRTYLPRRSYVLMRLDGKAFHTYTRGLNRPYDTGLMDDMNDVAKYLCENIQGAKFAYVQSDEISILITDFDKLGTNAYFDNQVQKLTSVPASMAGTKFNQLRLKRIVQAQSDENMGLKNMVLSALDKPLADFDCRVYAITDPFEVHNYFAWRQQDATRNSISMAAQSCYSHKELHGKSTSDMQEMMFQKGINWNDYPVRFKRGGFICKETYEVGAKDPVSGGGRSNSSIRTRWTAIDPPIFTQDTDFTHSRIPLVTYDGVGSLLDLRISNV